MRLTPTQTQAWVEARLEELELYTFDALSQETGIDRGTLSRYFRQERRPSIDAVGPLCKALKVSPEKILRVLGALD
jgi:transcriptional regulator with XRE-family HTH domain